MKLKHLSMHKLENVPDHIQEELYNLTTKLMEAIHPLIENMDSNIVIGAICNIHVIVLKNLVSDDISELKKATFMTCQSFIRNMEFLAKEKFIEEE